MMRAALERAGLAPGHFADIKRARDVDAPGSLAETKAIKEVFGGHACELAALAEVVVRIVSLR